MQRTDAIYQQYLQILREELVPAMGCTEPISIAYAAAVAKQVLEVLPERVELFVSGNILKNVKSVVVPNTGGLRGIATAAAAGIVAGNSQLQLEVISRVTPEQIKEISAFLEATKITVEAVDAGHIFDIGIRVYSGEHSAYVRIVDMHTNIVTVEKDGAPVPFAGGTCEQKVEKLTDRSCLSVQKILEFADIAAVEDLQDTIGQQIECNMAIAEQGIHGNYGANVGRTLLAAYGNDVKVRARAYAAAGSDARMNGCELPVIINSGSGNQGITASVPVIVYARELGVEEEKLYHALCVSNLCTIHLKTGIGRLSAYCGAVSAGCGSGAGIAYLMGGGYREIAHTLVNALAIVSGIVCDGAKASCAGKIAAAVDAGILGYCLFQQGNQFYGGDGIVRKGVENTISNIGILAHEGMSETDRVIIRLMEQ